MDSDIYQSINPPRKYVHITIVCHLNYASVIIYNLESIK
jgi:hypothetical protein